MLEYHAFETIGISNNVHLPTSLSFLENLCLKFGPLSRLVIFFRDLFCGVFEHFVLQVLPVVTHGLRNLKLKGYGTAISRHLMHVERVVESYRSPGRVVDHTISM